MNQSFYTGAVGAQQQMFAMNVQANNIANVNTVAFKSEKPRFMALLRQRMESIEDGNYSSGVGGSLMMTSTDYSMGRLTSQGGAQDYTILGDGYFAVVDLNTNEVTFTRNGAFRISFYERMIGTDEFDNPVYETVQTLIDNQGRFVLGRNGNIITVTNPNEKQNIGIFDYGNYDGMRHQSGTEFLPVDKNGNLYYGTGELLQGALEGSNVDLAESFTKVIEAQRAYTMSLKMIQTSDEIETTINNLR